MKKLLSLLLPIGILATASTAQISQPLAQKAMVAEFVDEPEAYYPLRDPEALMGHRLMDTLSENLWGTALDLEHWNLDLDEPLHEDDAVAYGQNRIGLPFTVEFATLYIAERDNALVGIWSGRLTGINDFYCYGLYYSQGDFATLIPIYSRVDQNRLAVIMGSVQNRWACALDSIGIWQQNQNTAIQQRCVESHAFAVKTLVVSCTSLGLATCWVPFSPPCLIALGCDGALLINEFIWQNEYEKETAMNNACLCNDVQFRQNNPTYPPESTTSSCSTFDCPTAVLPVIFH